MNSPAELSMIVDIIKFANNQEYYDFLETEEDIQTYENILKYFKLA